MLLTVLGIALCVYFAPSAIALFTRHPRRSEIVVTNLLLGWSILFWVFAFRTAMGWDKDTRTTEPTNL
ncbi:hypothetical protein JCM14469_18500 [Desulfatiferula olefinivorans]